MQILVKSFGVELFGEDLYEIVRVCALVGRWVCAHVLVRLYVCVRALARVVMCAFSRERELVRMCRWRELCAHLYVCGCVFLWCVSM